MCQHMHACQAVSWQIPKTHENSTMQHGNSCNPIHINTVHYARIKNIKTTPLTSDPRSKFESNVPLTQNHPCPLLAL